MNVIEQLKLAYPNANEDVSLGYDLTKDYGEKSRKFIPTGHVVLDETILRHGVQLDYGYLYARGEDAPYFMSREDMIHLPSLLAFDNNTAYVSVLAHELTHWTGHPDRLGRIPRDGLYEWQEGLEEMTASIGAALIMDKLGLLDEARMQEYSGYIRGWGHTAYINEPNILAFFRRLDSGESSPEASRSFEKAAIQAQTAVKFLFGE